MNPNILAERLKEWLPENIKYPLKLLRLHKSVTRVLGPRWKPNPYIIAVVVTYDCNLKCLNCNQSCRQAPTNESMSIEQVRKFIQESRDLQRQWKVIRLLGGEPTLHPQILAIIDLLLAYKKKYSPQTAIDLYTNGFGATVNDMLVKIPPEVGIWNTHKKSVEQNFFSINLAPTDLARYKNADYRNGCFTTGLCGIGLTPYGYYQCEVAGSIDRVFGFNLGRKQLPPINDPLADLFPVFCPYCGYFKHQNRRTNEEAMSPTWKQVYEKFKNERPALTLY